MNDNKMKVFSGTSQIQAMGFKNALSEASIIYYEIDKSDSAYAGLFNDIIIQVDADDEPQALSILKSLRFE
ncbi:MAG: hypothetical protein ABIO60_02975 [Aquaticitalea sp.]